MTAQLRARRAPLACLALALPLLLAGCVDTPTAAVEPASLPEVLAPVYEVVNETYDFGVMPTTTARLNVPSLVRVHGAMYVPQGDGPFPVLLFMHGNHGTCFLDGGYVPGLGVCRDVGPMRVDPSFAGYAYLAEDLASRGYVVLSINANDVNDQNQVDDLGANQRAQLFLRTLDDLAAMADPRFDLTRIGLMGHSRGGDGAARTVVLNAQRAEPYPLAGVFALAPTDFTRHQVVGVPFGTLLPYCDGDVSTLHGAYLYDDARYLEGAGPLHQFLVMGANHNAYNEVWPYDDSRYRDEDDGVCGTKGEGKLTPEDQRAGGLAIMGAFFRHHVGGEEALAPLLRGDAAFEVANTTIHVSYLPPAGERLTIEDTLDDAALSSNDVGGAFALTGADDASVCVTRAAAQGPLPATLFEPRFLIQGVEGTCPTEPNDATAPQLTFAHDASAVAAWTFPALDARGFDVVSLRLSIDFEASDTAPALAFRLRDAAGATAVVPAEGGVFHPPGDEAFRKLVLNDVRAPLAAFDGIDLAQLVEVALEIEGEPGRLHLTDVMLR